MNDQRSLMHQLEELIPMANRAGLYDAADYLRNKVDEIKRNSYVQPVCQVPHDHWEGPMICGNPLPCKWHG